MQKKIFSWKMIGKFQEMLKLTAFQKTFQMYEVGN